VSVASRGTPRAVLDTNIVVRGHISARGKPAAVLDAFYERRFVWITSAAILTEIDEVLRRGEVAAKTKMTAAEVTRFIQLLWLEAEVVPGLYDISGASPDPDDDKFLACAVEGRADAIVTADRSHLLTLHPYRLIDHVVKILTADAFLADLLNE
jgi:uncharacterized protein